MAEGLRGFRARHQLAVVCDALGEADEAERLWKQAVTEAPLWRPSWQGLAGLFLRQRRWDALEGAARGLEALPDAAAEASWWRGKALLEQGDAEGAAVRLAEAASRWPADGSLVVLYAHALAKCGDLPAAERTLLELLDLSPGDDRATQELALVRARLAARDQAFLDLREAG